MSNVPSSRVGQFDEQTIYEMGLRVALALADKGECHITILPSGDEVYFHDPREFEFTEPVVPEDASDDEVVKELARRGFADPYIVNFVLQRKKDRSRKR